MEKDDQDLREFLQNLIAEGSSERMGCHEEILEPCVIDFAKKFSVALPLEYVDFLRKANGLIFEDVVFCYVWDKHSKDESVNQLFPGHELFAVNEYHRQQKLPKKYIILGFDDTALFACNVIEGNYALLDSYGYSLLKKIESFEELLLEAIEGPI